VKKLLDIGICSAVLVSGAVCNDRCSMQFDCAGRWIWRQRALSCVARRVDLSIRNTSVRPWRKAAQPRGSLTNLGTGQLLRQRPTIFAGGTTMSADTLAAGDISHFSATLGGGPVSVALGANLGGSGSVVGDVANNGVTAGTSESWYLRNSAAAAPAVAPTQPSTAAGPATPGAPAGAPVATSPGTPDGEFSRHAHGHAARDRCTAGRLGVRVQPTFNSAGMNLATVRACQHPAGIRRGWQHNLQWNNRDPGQHRTNGGAVECGAGCPGHALGQCVHRGRAI
jgi:hypothetical protein